MTVLLLRLEGPMQAWGVDSRFVVRDTRREPSKSGVIGLLCAALGKPRAERPNDGFPRLAELAALRMGVRIDRPGRLEMDFHTAKDVAEADGRGKRDVLSRRYYLADASFLVGLEGEEALLRRLDDALRRPVWPLFLGRKSFVPGKPVRLPDEPPSGPGLQPGTLEEVLARHDRPPGRQRVVIDALPGPSSEPRPDVPVDFAARRFATRSVRSWLLEEGGA
ncbi:MAG: type I-E CRISPR-associated protein Cas5/CasD [Dehalococcoidia bacterium]|nr:type I-E CRISPR-associated protein Cas5/CasD [Dehalococcoidia bacterium]